MESKPEQTLLAQQGDTNGAVSAPADNPVVAGGKPADPKPEAPAADGAKAAESKPAAPAADGATPEQSVPDKYEFKLPEGQTLDESLAGKFSDMAKGLKLSQPDAQKLVDLYAAAQADQVKSFETQREQWRSQIKADPKHAEMLGDAKKALRLASPEQRAFIENSWLGDHPEMVRFLAKVGTLVKEDKVVNGNGGAHNSEPSLAAKMFPSMKK